MSTEIKEGTLNEPGEWSGQTLKEAEEMLVRKALIVNKGNILETAKALQISRATLYRMMKRYSLIKKRKTIGGDRSMFKR